MMVDLNRLPKNMSKKEANYYIKNWHIDSENKNLDVDSYNN